MIVTRVVGSGNNFPGLIYFVMYRRVFIWVPVIGLAASVSLNCFYYSPDRINRANYSGRDAAFFLIRPSVLSTIHRFMFVIKITSVPSANYLICGLGVVPAVDRLMGALVASIVFTTVIMGEIWYDWPALSVRISCALRFRVEEVDEFAASAFHGTGDPLFKVVGIGGRHAFSHDQGACHCVSNCYDLAYARYRLSNDSARDG